MAQIEINKQRFKELLPQFTGDVPYEIELINLLLEQLPAPAREGFMTEYFYSNYYKGELFVIQHVVFTDDIRYFLSIDEVIEYLKNYCLDKDHYLREVNKLYVYNCIKTKQPIFGYLITRKGVKENA